MLRISVAGESASSGEAPTTFLAVHSLPSGSLLLVLGFWGVLDMPIKIIQSVETCHAIFNWTIIFSFQRLSSNPLIPTLIP